MELDINSNESVSKFIKMIEVQAKYLEGYSDVVTFESFDSKINKPVLINYYKVADPVKLSINVQSTENQDNKIALFNEHGERIENEVEGEY